MEPYEYHTLFEFESFYWWYKSLHAILLDILRELGVGMNSVVLDAGCGTGKNLVNITSSITKYTFGFDLSLHTIPFWFKRGLKQVCLASINNIPFPDDTFDVALSIDVLEADEVNDKFAYSELWRVVKPNGFIVLTVPAYKWLLTANHHKAVHASRRYDKQTLCSLLNSRPADIVRFTYLFASIFPAIASYRLGMRYLSPSLEDSQSPRSELHHLPTVLNKILFWIVDLERRILKRIDMPFGSSFLAVVRKVS